MLDNIVSVALYQRHGFRKFHPYLTVFQCSLSSGSLCLNNACAVSLICRTNCAGFALL